MMNAKSKVYLIGGGIGSLSAAAFMIRDGGLPGGEHLHPGSFSHSGREPRWRRRSRARLFHARRAHVDQRQL